MRLGIAALSLNQTPLDFSGNLHRLVAALTEAREAGVHVVVGPELCLSGYGAEDAFLWPDVAEQSLESLAGVLPHTLGMVAVVGLPLRYEGKLFNAGALLADGKLVGFGCKRHLAGDGVHYEPRWFSSWPRGLATRIEVNLAGQVESVPIGDWVFALGELRLGFEICEDAWVRERPGAELNESGVDLIVNPSASHFAFGKHAYRRGLVETGSERFECIYVYANLLGNEAGRCIYDGDGLIAVQGSVIASNRRFSFRDHSLTLAEVSWEPRARSTSRRPVHSHPFEFAGRPFASHAASSSEAGLLAKEQEFARAVALGLFDYARKSKSRGFVVSLSGGADSAACALLVRLMLRLALRARGLDEVKGLLGQAAATSESELQQVVLTTVYQSTENSGAVTRNAARSLATALGATHHEFDVDPIFQLYRRLGEQALGRPLEFPQDDVPLQNLQARARSPGAWLLANVQGALLLSTSNRSEAAVGYATMDGDTSGGLAPIAGIDKFYLRKWLEFMETVGLEELAPCLELAAINAQAPTAELRPPSYTQTDEVDLMPYDVLNEAESAFVSKRGGPRDVLEHLCARFPQYSPSELVHWTRRFFQLFTRNQWKRERYAPSFHLDDRSLDPKTWCRFPILSRAFADELAHLDEAVGQVVRGTRKT